jgi:hypothetical protein
MTRLTNIGATIALLLTALASVLASVLASQPAEARHFKHHYASQTRHTGGHHSARCALTNDGRQVCGRAIANRAAILDATGNSVLRGDRAAVVDATGNRAVLAADEGAIIGSRPSGCPHSYCGCGLRMYLGLADVRLNLASNWSRLFPHESAPRAGLAAVRSGHVMYIEGAAGNGQWLIRDYNSGGGLSRVHVRDVRGYAFVNPHAQLATR